MNRHNRWMLLLLGVLVCAWLSAASLGCAAAQPTLRPIARPEGCAVKPGKPSFCFPEGGEPSVIGLPSGHGWAEGDWVMFEVYKKAYDEPIPAAFGVVKQVPGGNADFVTVQILHQADVGSLDDARARKIPKSERVRLGKFVGRVLEVRPGEVRLDVGAKDGVMEGDVYELLSDRDHASIGRLRITQVEDMNAFARVIGLGPREGIRPEQAAIFVPYASSTADPIRILVVNFDPHVTTDPEEARLGAGFAKEFAEAMARAADGSSMEVRYAQGERVRLGAGEEEAHESARQIGKRNGVDIVVWGAMRCREKACAQPRYTVVHPSAFVQRGYAGADVWMEKDLRFEESAAKDPLGLAAAMLGEVAFYAHRSKDAAMWLGRALASGVLVGDDELVALREIAFSMLDLDQRVAARQHINAMLARARAMNDAGWKHRALAELGRIDLEEGDLDAAQGRLGAVWRWALANEDVDEQGFVQLVLGDLEAKRGNFERARTLYDAGQASWHDIDKVDWDSAIAVKIANVERIRGNTEEAVRFYTQALELSHRGQSLPCEQCILASLGDIAMDKGELERARIYLEKALVTANGNGRNDAGFLALVTIARLRKIEGNIDEAFEYAKQAAAMTKRVGDAGNAAVALSLQADLEQHVGRMDQARQLFELALAEARRVGNMRHEASVVNNLGHLDLVVGRPADARKRFERALELRRYGNKFLSEGAVLHNLACVERMEGHFEKARSLFARAIELQQKESDEMGVRASIFALAELELHAGRIEEARKLYEQALSSARRMGDLHGEAVNLHGLGAIAMHQGRLDEAEELTQRAISLKRRMKVPGDEAASLHQLAVVYDVKGDLDAAAMMYTRALEMARRCGNMDLEATTIYPLARTEIRRGNLVEARKLFVQARELHRRVGYELQLLATEQNLAWLDHLEGRSKDARAALAGLLGKAKALSAPVRQAEILDMLARIDIDDADFVLAKQRFNEALAIFQKLQIGAEVQRVNEGLAELLLVQKVHEARKAHPELAARGGILISELQPGGQAEKLGLAPGDILLRYGSTRVNEGKVLRDLATSTDPAKTVTVEAIRGSQRLTFQAHGGLLGIAIADVPPAAKSQAKPNPAKASSPSAAAPASRAP
ncbi:tetratricopeptide repeat protein [Polyangium sp. 6x1]|uniref:tetratricopeptide repeat protein n=1 Tax=Polyangium sp. 6x1 TaxID=3042689 RepID=UPI002482E8AD|nr:tetratricopeptide repeat protein [Polyangium sp. 6x1]